LGAGAFRTTEEIAILLFKYTGYELYIPYHTIPYNENGIAVKR